MTDAVTTFFIAPTGEGHSALDRLLALQGVRFNAGLANTDGPEDFAEAERAAHDEEACLPDLHDVVLEAAGESLSDEALRRLLRTLPDDIKAQIGDWGLADTEVRERISAYIGLHGI